MPKTYDLSVSPAERLSLLRFAIMARLTATRPAGRERRGAPQLPAALEGRRSHRWLTTVLYGKAEPEAGALLDLVDAIEQAAPADDKRLRDLAVSFSAVDDPRRIAEGVADARFWPSLRGLGVSRHPVDLAIAGYSAVNYLQRGADSPGGVSALSARDARAVERVMNGLTLVALGEYPFNGSAVDLLAALYRWRPRHLRRRLNEPSGRRLTRALDKSVRMHLRLGAEIRTDDLDFFEDAMAASISALVPTPLHTATSSSAPALRLARLILMRHPDPLNDGNVPAWTPRRQDAVQEIVSRLQDLSRGDDGTTDVLLRREAAWYLVEADNLVSSLAEDRRFLKTGRDNLEHLCSKRQESALFDDLRVMANIAEYRRTQSREERHPPGTWRDNFTDLVRDPSLTDEAFPSSATRWKALLDELVPPRRIPRTTAWRRLTHQVALPTIELTRELLWTPWSARARWIADAFRASDESVVEAVAELLEAVLQNEDAVNGQVLAKRAAWTAGFIRPQRKSLLQTLIRVAKDEGVPSDVSADAAWALGDLASTHNALAEGAEAIDALKDVLQRGEEHVEVISARIGEGKYKELASLDPGPLLRAQAALHSLAIQLHARYAGDVGSAAETFERERKAIEKSLAAWEHTDGSQESRDLRRSKAFGIGRQHIRNTWTMADWALRRVDAGVALTYV